MLKGKKRKKKDTVATQVQDIIQELTDQTSITAERAKEAIEARINRLQSELEQLAENTQHASEEQLTRVRNEIQHAVDKARAEIDVQTRQAQTLADETQKALSDGTDRIQEQARHLTREADQRATDASRGVKGILGNRVVQVGLVLGIGYMAVRLLIGKKPS